MSKIHVQVKNFIKNPYVVRLDHNIAPNGAIADYMGFRKIISRTRQSCAKTWGYSNATPERTATDDTTTVYTMRSYWLFQDEMDALQFKLIHTEAVRMIIWPKIINFTIYEQDN